MQEIHLDVEADKTSVTSQSELRVCYHGLLLPRLLDHPLQGFLGVRLYDRCQGVHLQQSCVAFA